MMDPARFTGLGFVASYWNADPSIIKPMGVVDSLAVQIAWGTRPADRTEPGDELRAWVSRCASYGLEVQAWGWCDAHDVPSARAEGIYHAERAIDVDISDVWIANMEAPYDAGGNQTSPKFNMPDAYAEGFVERASSLGVNFRALGLTTTPFFGSSQWGLAKAGWVTMPQAFSADFDGATIPASVAHMKSWGWPVRQIRPLVQVYVSPYGARPEADTYVTDAQTCDVGVIPYIVEQAMDSEGRTMLTELIPVTFRPPSNGEDDVELIGNQNGVVAACNRLRDLDAGGTLLVKQGGKWPDISTLANVPLDQWKAYDKLQRTLSMLVSGHDEMVQLQAMA